MESCCFPEDNVHPFHCQSLKCGGSLYSIQISLLSLLVLERLKVSKPALSPSLMGFGCHCCEIYCSRNIIMHQVSLQPQQSRKRKKKLSTNTELPGKRSSFSTIFQLPTVWGLHVLNTAVSNQAAYLSVSNAE